MKFKLNMEPEQVYEAVIASVTRARNHTDDVEWSPEDGTRTEHDFLCRCVEAAIKAGATTINIPDTVGYTVPEEFAALIRMLRERVPNADQAVFSAHCHNDLGLAVANSLAGLEGGVRQIECTINGLGERAGNAALEEIVMAIKTRGDVLPYTTNIDTTMLLRASKLVSAVTAFPVQYNKAIVGKNAFAHEAGIHQDGMLKHAQTYEIMRPEDVGVHATSLVMGKHSGRHAFREKLKELGFELGDNAFEDAFRRFKALADRKKHVFDEDLEALVEDEVAVAGETIRIVGADRDRRHQRAAEGDADPRRERHRGHQGDHRQRPGRRDLQRHPRDRAAHRQAVALPGPRGDRGHRRPGRGLRQAGGGRQVGDGARRRSRYAGRLGQGLHLGDQQADGEARPHPRPGGGRRVTGS